MNEGVDGGEDVRAHDPSMIKGGETYYVFSRGDVMGRKGGGSVQIRASTDLRNWRYAGATFDTIPTWVTASIGPILNLWAPDIAYVDGLYRLYYAGSHFGTTHSVIGLATNTTLDIANDDYKWIDQGLVIQSRPSDDWNAIDPNLVIDGEGQAWLTFGSFWSGIKLLRLNRTTGKPSRTDQMVHALACRPGSGAVESPCIIHRDGFYYLFVSFDACCKGVDSTYRIMVGRSRSVIGPYLDRTGVAMTDGGGTVVLAGYDHCRGPGGQSVLRVDSVEFLVHHYYDARVGGDVRLQVRDLTWTPDGWPCAGSPYVP